MAAGPDDQTGLMWSDPLWPWRPLNRVTALQYFEHSPFYDPNSNNAAARAQNLDPSNEAVLRSFPADRPEFVLAEAQEPHLFVIRRQLRAPPISALAGGAGGRAATQAVYYILGDAGHTFQAPSLHAAVNARLQRCMRFVRAGFGRFKRDLAPLPRLLRTCERQAAAAADLAAREAAERDALRGVVAGGPLGPDAAARVAAAGGEAPGPDGGVVVGGAPPGPAAGAALGAEPMDVPEVLTAAERRHWERTDEIIARVLRRYRAPRLAPEEGPDGAAPQPDAAPQQPEGTEAAAVAAAAAAAAAAGAPAPQVKAEAGSMPAPSVSAAAAAPPTAAAAPAPLPPPARAAPSGLPAALPSASQGSVQPSQGGSVLTASRAPKVRIKLPRSSGSGGGGGSSGGGVAPGADGEPAAKRSRG